jgi:hypothetical protein
LEGQFQRDPFREALGVVVVLVVAVAMQVDEPDDRLRVADLRTD